MIQITLKLVLNQEHLLCELIGPLELRGQHHPTREVTLLLSPGRFCSEGEKITSSLSSFLFTLPMLFSVELRAKSQEPSTKAKEQFRLLQRKVLSHVPLGL